MSPTQDPPSHPSADQVRVQGIEVDFVTRRPKHRLIIKFESSDGMANATLKFGKKEAVRWEGELFLSASATLSVSIQELLCFKRTREFATVSVPGSEMGDQHSNQFNDTQKKILLKLSSYTAIALAEIVEDRVEEATKQLAQKEIILERLGQARGLVDVIMKFAAVVSDIHPGAAAGIAAIKALYEQCQQQEDCHQSALDLLEDLTLFLPFTSRAAVPTELMKSNNTRQTVLKMLTLIKQASDFIIEYSSMSALGEMISSQQKSVDDFKASFRKLKDVYDWYIKMEIWKTVLNTERLGEDQQLRHLHPAENAYFHPDKGCLEGTRSALLEQVSQWANSADPASPKLCWVYGLAGSGKTSVSNTVARMLNEQNLLSGCFLCKRDDPILHDPTYILPTLAYHMAKWHEPYRSAILSVLQGSESTKVDAKNLGWQFDLLFEKPLLSLSQEPPIPVIFVIDALDESGNSQTRAELASYIVKLADTVPWIKVFLTSRLLPEIQDTFTMTEEGFVTKLDIRSFNAQQDIVAFTRMQLGKIKSLDQQWLREKQVATLSGRAFGLFIWASTVCKFISDSLDPNYAVEKIFRLSKQSEESAYDAEAGLDALYRTVIQEISQGNPDNLVVVKTILGTITSTAQNKPLSEDALFAFLPTLPDGRSIPKLIFVRIIDSLLSVLYRDLTADGAVRVLHPSFLDFLINNTRSQQFHSDAPYMELHMATRCLQIMTSELKFNICNLRNSCLRNYQVQDLQEQIVLCISQQLKYSCLYWSKHLSSSSCTKVQELVEDFLCHPRMLYWIEVLSLIGYMQEGRYAMQKVAKLYEESEIISTVALQCDIFLGTFYRAIAHSTPHLYISALPWAPPNSFISQKLSPLFPNKVQVITEMNTLTTWGKNEALEKEESTAKCTAIYSPDNKYIISIFGEDGIYIWDATTGLAVREPLQGISHGEVLSVACSFDGANSILAGYDDGSICIWDMHRGTLVREPLMGHSGSVKCVAYSPDGIHFASGSSDCTLCIWERETGALLFGNPLKGHHGPINSIAYSPDGKHIASASDDQGIRIWNAETGSMEKEVLRLYNEPVISICYSPDGERIVSGSHGEVCIIDAKTGKFSDTVCSRAFVSKFIGSPVAYAPNGEDVVFGLDNITGLICFWGPIDVPKGMGMVKRWIYLKSAFNPMVHFFPYGVTSIAFSYGGKHILSAHNDKTIRVRPLNIGERGIFEESHIPELSHTVIQENQWLMSSTGDLLLWIPKTYSSAYFDSFCSIRIPPSDNPLTIDWSKYVHGESWTSVISQVVA